jgi:hypothetical protein
VLRLRHLLGVLERNPEHQARVGELLRRFWREVDTPRCWPTSASRRAWTCGQRARPAPAHAAAAGTPATTDLGELFAPAVPDPRDALWLARSIDDETLCALLQAPIAPAT